MQKILFGVIALLFMGIAGVVVSSQMTLAKQTPTKSSTTTTDAKTKTLEETVTDKTETYTMAEVATHATVDDCYTVVDGSVYDLTPFVKKHPGGVKEITRICGIDGSAAFNAQHGGDRKPASTLKTFEIGALAE
ncbi:hypothetical protein A2392_00690 [Candidatus Kaiserbacteria bacterium RIFOXYB1_FULL_46_14]|uniref:Cytochrome b5 heme-binding domain-containing protein n=1 Tax=Candidatus Kaiserbacteria bacterium RIFOXYB1_FULL_46_14 TaxID=1798531 RepID=A0A1F6FJ79_9BACT|nr:MAG: hypothetical protein A2392_00690 [Candidatus Kaiserbacteria bacterium RIFOXYB1_FULL_46_14]